MTYSPTLRRSISRSVMMVGVAEIASVDRRSARTMIVLMACYDSGWVVATVVALLRWQAGSAAGGETWLIYQAAAAIALTALVAVGVGRVGRPTRAADVRRN